MCSFKSIYFVIFILNLYKTNAQISDKRLCVDPDCKEPVSHAKTLLRYSSPDQRILSFLPNVEVTIYSKEAGSEAHLWGAEIKGKRGYVPKHLVREYKLLKKPNILVDTELNQKPQVPIDANKEIVEPNKVQEPFEVVDGTTIYANPQDGIIPTSTENPALSTAVPPSSSEEDLKKAEPLNSVEDGTDNESIKAKNADESVVHNVIQTFSDWITDDSEKSQEIDDSEDDFDEGDDEEDDYEDEDEEDENNNLAVNEDDIKYEAPASKDEKTESDIIKLHNLPSDIKISPYGLEVDQPLAERSDDGNKESITSSMNGSSQQKAILDTVPPPDNHSNAQNTAPEEVTKEETDNIDNPTPKLPLPIEELPLPIEKLPLPIETGTEVPLSDEVVPPNIVLDEVTPNPMELETEAKGEEPLTESTGDTATLPANSNFVDGKIQQEHSKPPNTESSPASVNAPDNSDEIPTGSSEEMLNNGNLSSSRTSTENQEPTNTFDPPENDGFVEPVDDTVKIPALPLGGFFNKAQNDISQEDTNKDPKEKDLAEIIPEKKEEIVPDIIVNETMQDAGNEHINDDLADKADPMEKDLAEIIPEKKEETVPEIIVNETMKDAGNEHINDDLADKVALHEESANVLLNAEAGNDTQEPEPVSEEIKNALNEEVVSQNSIEYGALNEELATENSTESVENEGVELETNLEEPESNITTDEDAQSQEGTITEGMESGGLFSFLLSLLFGRSNKDEVTSDSGSTPSPEINEPSIQDDILLSESHKQDNVEYDESHCEAAVDSRPEKISLEKNIYDVFDIHFNPNIFLYLITTAISVILFLFGYLAFDRNRRDAPLVARINKLEKELLVTLKENELLQERRGSSGFLQQVDDEQLSQKDAEFRCIRAALEQHIAALEKELESKLGLEEQLESLEKELETSTEVGMELNRIISEMLDPTNGSEKLQENVEQLQRQLLEQRDTINTIRETLSHKENENRKLHKELDKSKKKANNLQSKVDEMVEKIVKIEREKDVQQNILQSEITTYQQKYNQAIGNEDIRNNEIQVLRVQLSEVQRQAELKTKEYQTLSENIASIKSIKNDGDALRALLDSSSMKAELQQLKAENEKYLEQLQQEKMLKTAYEKKYQLIVEEVKSLKQKYDQADKEKVEVNSKLDVLNNYFQKREGELQEEIIKYKSIWDAKEGEATSTTERMKYMQEEIENYKAQNEALKQEIISQEIDLKSQITVLEKKVHENWVKARQTERRLDDARQEAAQLRNRLTLRETTINERLQSPLDQNGDLTHPMDSPASPPLLYGARDHITKSPPLPGLPPFLPPPPGAPFMPPPIHGMPPFMPPPPAMYPGDHRPPPLGRISSPPLNSRYSPDTSAFSPYDRNSPSPPYDSEYGGSPPPLRGYSPYNSRDDRRDYKRPPHVRTNGRNMKGSMVSSGSEHSNDSLDKINRKHSKKV